MAKMEVLLTLVFCLMLLASKVGICSTTTAKRPTSCEDKFNAFPGHSACLEPSEKFISGGVSAEDKMLIVDQHNKYRRQIKHASDMQMMVWDDELERVAEGWAKQCISDHEDGILRRIPGRFSVGQNLGIDYTSWENCISGWFNESKDFRYNDSSVKFEDVGHFTQLVWSGSSLVGCAFAVCKGASGNQWKFYVCNYGPSGNVAGTLTPYNVGEKCGGCNLTCNDGLCDCGGIVCYNGGILDLNTCSCSCFKNFHVGHQCELDCNLAQDEWYCESHYTRSACGTQNAPLECPNMCSICPWSGRNYTAGSVTVPGPGSNYTEGTVTVPERPPPIINRSADHGIGSMIIIAEIILIWQTVHG
ncbi:cysteine-rich venom protein latisemin [Lingula anatina]|uniref:Cysteine-rich venom protein latisemin n=1 Tax=Lingula anatina TaxID=7574 RepID=A0A1S3JZZ8_LINAN|nr:cysteine-rich venom protein latisemin [Lingula anatina]|eukprot:XP_013415601.1 cysteine-rich venom protein latisemin [Lingula anatina]